jgi:hypothetical protein
MPFFKKNVCKTRCLYFFIYFNIEFIFIIELMYFKNYDKKIDLILKYMKKYKHHGLYLR